MCIVAFKFIFTINFNNKKSVLNVTVYKYCKLWSFTVYMYVLCFYVFGVRVDL